MRGGDCAPREAAASASTSTNSGWGRSRLRHTAIRRAGIDFPGWDASVSYLIAEVQMTDEPASGVRVSLAGAAADGDLPHCAARIAGDPDAGQWLSPAVEQPQCLLGHAAPPRVREVAERDDPHAVLRQPAHQRAEARQPARVRHRRRE